jgi:hypothetical protein
MVMVMMMMRNPRQCLELCISTGMWGNTETQHVSRHVVCLFVLITTIVTVDCLSKLSLSKHLFAPSQLCALRPAGGFCSPPSAKTQTRQGERSSCDTMC